MPEPNNNSKATIEFIEFIESHKSSLKSGEYKVTVKQNVELKDRQTFDKTPSTEINLAVFGERFSLQPQEIYTSFPPAGSLGDWSKVLPHIAFRRSTLPWERSAIVDKAADKAKDRSWLTLLLFTEEEYRGEKPEVLPLQLLTLGDLQTKAGTFQDINLKDLAAKAIGSLSTELSAKLENFQVKPVSETDFSIGKTYFPTFELERSQKKDDPVTVIDVKKSLLEKILPKVDELDYLSHVRHTKNEEDRSNPETDNSIAVVIGNRLPQKNVNNTVYLISLENRYTSKGFNYPKDEKDNDYYLRFVVLNSWQFTCVDPKYNFKGLLSNLNSDRNNPNNEQSSTLRLPKSSTEKSAIAEEYLSRGYVPLHHNLRQGGNTISWYHSPLIPASNQTDIKLSTLSVFTADRLVCYDPNDGMFDVSYAAAWELGRLLALKDSQFSLNLCNWKRDHIKELIQNNRQALYSHLFPSIESQKNEKPVQWSPDEWLKDLGLLKGIPFNYLVPDEQMLPQESIRFFHLDWFWVECLLDGAFSLGRGLGQQQVSNKLLDRQDISGFLLRSQVVSGWQDLQVVASDRIITNTDPISDREKLELLRCDRLSESVLLCLFTGKIKTVDISLKPQGLHFGFDLNTDRNSLFKGLRDLDTGRENSLRVENISFNEDPKNRVINIQKLFKDIEEKININKQIFTSAQFALQMIQGTEKVRFFGKND